MVLVVIDCDSGNLDCPGNSSREAECLECCRFAEGDKPVRNDAGDNVLLSAEGRLALIEGEVLIGVETLTDLAFILVFRSLMRC